MGAIGFILLCWMVCIISFVSDFWCLRTSSIVRRVKAALLVSLSTFLLSLKIQAMPTLKEINGSPPKAAIRTPKDCKKPAASVGGNPFLSSERSNDDRYMKMSADSKVANSAKKKPSSSNKGKSRKRSGRQISIFESIGATPPTENVLTPPNVSVSTGGKSSNADDSAKKRKRRTISQPNCGAFPICVNVSSAMEGKEAKKVVITCHGVKNEFSDAIACSSPIVVKEKYSLPKDPMTRFLKGFGRFIH